MNYNAAEREDVKRANKAAKLAETQRREVVSGLMSTPPGRRYVLEQLERSHLFTTSFTGDALTSAYSEGERNIGLQLLDDIMRSCPDRYITMMQERNERDLANERHASRERAGSENSDGGVEDPNVDNAASG